MTQSIRTTTAVLLTGLLGLAGCAGTESPSPLTEPNAAQPNATQAQAAQENSTPPNILLVLSLIHI